MSEAGDVCMQRRGAGGHEGSLLEELHVRQVRSCGVRAEGGLGLAPHGRPGSLVRAPRTLSSFCVRRGTSLRATTRTPQAGWARAWLPLGCVVIPKPSHTTHARRALAAVPAVAERTPGAHARWARVGVVSAFHDGS